MESAGDLLIEIIVVDDGTSPALERPEFTGAALVFGVGAAPEALQSY